MHLLSWNSCSNVTFPGMQIFLPKQSSAQPFTASVNPSAKRKRAPPSAVEEHGHEVSWAVQQSNMATQPVAVTTSHSKSPTVGVLPQPSEGLPKPLQSPTGSKMESFQYSNPKIMPANKDHAASGLLRTRQVIQQQINLEILLKHNELRLIDQELAKCQTALEQLRRCKEIPYPICQPNVIVTNGDGPSLRSSFSGRPPKSPAPWGVTDGPYSRHYAQWLLPDSRFDGGEPGAQTVVSGKRPTKTRSIRTNVVDEPQFGMSSRSQQRSGKLKALPAGYGQPKEKSQGPLILKRKSDGVMVKLICPVCSRGDFGSAQGFINHCRIGHGRNFSSHDQAAEQCGEPVELDENGAVVGQELVTTPSTSFVHPLIRTARLNQSASPARTPVLPTLDGATDAPRPSRPSISPDFRASLQTPHLSDLLMNKGLPLNLQDIVTEAKIKVELPESDDEEMEYEQTIPSPEEVRYRHPQVAGTRGISKPAKSPATSPVLQSRIPVAGYTGPEILNQGKQRTVGAIDDAVLSPTTEFNQAPSLIDDDEEFEVHSPDSSSASEVTDEGEVDFAVRDDDDDRDHDVLQQPEPQPSCSQAGDNQATRGGRPSALRSTESTVEPKHVTFVSENPGAPKVGGDKKRRKVTKS